MSDDKTKARIQLLAKQKEFIFSTVKETLFTGGWRSGKTGALCFKAFIEAQKPNNKILIARKTHKSLMETTYNDGWVKLIPRGTYHLKKQESIITFPSGSEILLIGLDDFHKIRGHTLGSIFVDEAIDLNEDDYTELIYGRLSLETGNRQIYLATNPATPDHWIYRKFIAQNNIDRKYITSTPYDNPFLPKDYLNKFEDLKRDDLEKYNRMVLGKWFTYENAIFNNFSRDKNTKDIQKHYRNMVWDRILIGFDFGQKHPTGILVAGIYGDQVFVLEEFKKSMCLIDVLKKTISEYCNKYSKYGRPTVIYDPSCLLIANELDNIGIEVQKADNTVDMGIAKVKDMLTKEQLIIDSNCPMLITEMENYRYIEGTEKPIKEQDDLVDPLRYICQTLSTAISTVTPADIFL